MTGSITTCPVQGLPSADSLETTGAGAPADALGEPKRMSKNGSGSNQSGGYTDDQLLDRLRDFAAVLGRTPTSTEMDTDGPHTARTYQNHFGSWNGALDNAGLSRNRNRGEPDEHLINAVRNLASELGETPTAQDMRSMGKYGAAVFFRRFGSWNDALERAGFELNKASPGDGEYGPGWNEETRETVREGQDRTCEDCGISEADYMERTETRLDVHHEVDPDDSTNPAVYNAPRNLVALCRSCHSDRHSND